MKWMEVASANEINDPCESVSVWMFKGMVQRWWNDGAASWNTSGELLGRMRLEKEKSVPGRMDSKAGRRVAETHSWHHIFNSGRHGRCGRRSVSWSEGDLQRHMCMHNGRTWLQGRKTRGKPPITRFWNSLGWWEWDMNSGRCRGNGEVSLWNRTIATWNLWDLIPGCRVSPEAVGEKAYPVLSYEFGYWEHGNGVSINSVGRKKAKFPFRKYVWNTYW